MNAADFARLSASLEDRKKDPIKSTMRGSMSISFMIQKMHNAELSGTPPQRWFAPPAAGTNVGVELNSVFAPPSFELCHALI